MDQLIIKRHYIYRESKDETRIKICAWCNIC
jgi:hypothetical protein